MMKITSTTISLKNYAFSETATRRWGFPPRASGLVQRLISAKLAISMAVPIGAVLHRRYSVRLLG